MYSNIYRVEKYIYVLISKAVHLWMKYTFFFDFSYYLKKISRTTESIYTCGNI